MSNERTFLQLFGGTAGSGIDWIVIFTFIAVAAVYFLAPAAGYRDDRRGALAAALYVLIGYGGLSLMHLFMQYVILLDSGPSRSGRDEWGLHLLFAFLILKLLVFLVAMVLFTVGLQSLRQRTSTKTEVR